MAQLSRVGLIGRIGLGGATGVTGGTPAWVLANGAPDFYFVNSQYWDGAGNKTVNGNAQNTWFDGIRVSL